MVKQVINVGTTANDRSGDPLRIAFQKVNDNFTELYISADPSSLVNGNKIVSLGANGTLIVPSPTSNVFTLTFAPSNYVATGPKPILTLAGTPWALQGQYGYNSRGETELMLDNIWPTLVNPGYTSGDSFTFDASVHGIVGHVLTIQLNNVVLPGGAGWTANVAASQPPEYPSTITSQGAIKVTSNNNNWIFGTDGELTLPGEVYIKNGINGAIIGDSASSGLNINTYDAAPLGLNWYSTSIFGTPNTNPNPGDPAWDISSSAINFGWNGISVIVNDSLNNSSTWTFGPDGKLTTPNNLKIYDANENINYISSNSGLDIVSKGLRQLKMTWDPTGETIPSDYDQPISLRTSASADIFGFNIEVLGQDFGGRVWTFGPDGKLKIPNGGDIVDGAGNSVLGGGSSLVNAYTRVTTPFLNSVNNNTVIWTALYDMVSSVKLTIQLETNQVGDATGWHSQVCEAVIASRGYANGQSGYGEPIITVYGVTYTSTVPLATFTVQRNAITRMIEIVATRTTATDSGIDFRIHSIEMTSRD